MDRFTISEAVAPILNEDGEEGWAYMAMDGHLRCPDCNSDHEAEGGAFPALPWHGAVAVTDEVCADCGVLLLNDPACSPSEIMEGIVRSNRLFGAESVYSPEVQLAALLAS